MGRLIPTASPLDMLADRSKWTPRDRASLALVALSLCAGIAVFSVSQYQWVHHASLQGVFRINSLILPGGLLVAVTLAWRHTSSRRRLLLLRSSWILWLSLIALALAVFQLCISSRTPWLHYAWIALLIAFASRLTRLLELPAITRRQSLAILAFALTLMIALHVYIQYSLWEHLSFGYRDIGLFARALHNAASGGALWVDSLNRSLLGEHSCFALWMFVPFCRLGIPAFDLLVLASAALLNGPALIIWAFARKRFDSEWGGLLAALSWLLLPSLGCLAIAQGYGFHEVYIAVPILVGALALTINDRMRSAALCMFAALLVREDLALTVCAWAVYIALVKRWRGLGFLIFLMALAYFIAMVAVVIPHYRGAPYPHMAFHFRQAGEANTTLQSLAVNISFLMTLLLPMAVFPLGRLSLCLIALPALLETILTTNPELHNLCFHYYTPALPILFFAAIESWYRMTRSTHHRFGSVTELPPKARARVIRPGLTLLVAAAMGQTYLGIGPLTNNPASPITPPELRAEFANIRQIKGLAPSSISVTASYRIAAHFLDHDQLWEVGNDNLGDLVIVDDRDNWDASRPRRAVIRAAQTGRYQPVFANHHLVVLIRQDEPTPLAANLMPAHFPKDMRTFSEPISPAITCVGIDTHLLPPGVKTKAGLKVTLIWRCLGISTGDDRFGLVLADNQPRWGPFYFAHGAYPTSAWIPGQLYRDEILVEIPPQVRIEELATLRPILVTVQEPQS